MQVINVDPPAKDDSVFRSPLVLLGLAIVAFFGVDLVFLDSDIAKALGTTDASPGLQVLIEYRFLIGALVALVGCAVSMLFGPSSAARREVIVTVRTAAGDSAPSSLDRGDRRLAEQRAREAEELARRHRPEDALTAFREARDLYRAAGDRLGEADCLRAIAHLSVKHASAGRAREAFAEARQLYQQANATAGEATLLLDLGNLEGMVGAEEPARRAYRDALALFNKLGDHRGEANVLYGLGFVERQADPRLAEQRFTQAARLFEEAGALDWRDIALAEASDLKA